MPLKEKQNKETILPLHLLIPSPSLNQEIQVQVIHQ